LDSVSAGPGVGVDMEGEGRADELGLKSEQQYSRFQVFSVFPFAFFIF
jgi:hypothetical protein